MAGHYFVSYSRQDAADFALRLAGELQGRPPHHRLWVDVLELQSGSDDWDDQLSEAIQTCDGLLFVMSDDSIRRGSGCKDEWNWALKYKKPVIPLQLHAAAGLPFRLASRQSLDFTADFATGVAQLRSHLHWTTTDKGVLQELLYRLADAERERPRADSLQQVRIEKEIEQLRGRIDAQRRLVDNPRGVVEETDARIEAGMERERRPERPVAPPQRAKFVNRPPMTAPGYFQDRDVETGLLAAFLRDDATRMMTVVGRGGVGKTAMVCRLLKALESGRLPDEGGELDVDGIVYLSPHGAHPVDFPHVFSDLCRLLTRDVAEPLLERSHDPHETPMVLMRALLEHFPDGRSVLLLDNFEDVVDADGIGLTDSALDDGLRALLDSPPHGVKVVITTRIAPRDLMLLQPGVQRRLNLDDGLESPFAEDVLREMDADGSLGIQHAPTELLGQARERTRGFPKALEALAAILAADRDTTLPELLANTERMPENVVEALVGGAFSRLDALAQQVLQALAIYPGAVPPVAVDYLLQPFDPAIDSAPVLGRLVNMQFVRRGDAGHYYLHQVDRDYALHRVPAGEPSDRHADPPPFSRYALRERAADFFEQIRTPRETWRSLDDLAPQRAEFDLRCEAGDHDTAAHVLFEISFDYLQIWGQARVALDLHESLQGHLNDSSAQAENFQNLGTCHWALGEYRRAIEFHELALAVRREDGDRWNEGTDLGNLGNCYYVLGELWRATELFEEALVIAREVGDHEGVGVHLANSASCYSDLGENRRAIELLERALAIAREVGDRRGEAIRLGNLGNRYADRGDLHRGIAFYEQALEIDRELGDREGEANDLLNLAGRFAELGETDRAIDLCERALEIDRKAGHRRGEALTLIQLARAYADAGAWSQATREGEQAVRLADAVGVAQASSEGRVDLATTFLLMGRIDMARTMVEAARAYDYPRMDDDAALVLGIALARDGLGDAARAAFREAVDAADAMLALTADASDEQYTRALALCGLALLEDADLVSEAIGAFRSARAVTSADGIVARVLRLFDALAVCDEAGMLAPVRAVAAGQPDAAPGSGVASSTP